MNGTHVPRMVVLVSGKGSNFEAIIRAVRSGQIAARLVSLISNRPEAGALEIARNYGIPATTVDHRNYADRAAFDLALMQAIDACEPDLIVLAGFMRILTPAFVDHYEGRLLNIHPSLLPAYPGLATHERVLADGVSLHGASVHFVTRDLDGGPVILQASLTVHEDDTPERLAERVHQLEHQIYPQAIAWFAGGRLRLVNNQATLDGRPLEKPLPMETLTREAPLS